MMESRFEINSNSEKRFMHGWINLVIRFYYYFKEGVNQVNGLRSIAYILIGIAGVFALKDSPHGYVIVGVIAIALVPVLTVLGWLWVTRGKKSEEYYQVRYTSAYGKYQVEMQEEQLRQNERIVELLQVINDKLHASNT